MYFLSRVSVTIILSCRVFARLWLPVSRRLTYPFGAQTALTYHIVRAVVQYSKIGCPCPSRVKTTHYRAAALVSAFTSMSRYPTR
jgi:hypothetical protein